MAHWCDPAFRFFPCALAEPVFSGPGTESPEDGNTGFPEYSKQPDDKNRAHDYSIGCTVAKKYHTEDLKNIHKDTPFKRNQGPLKMIITWQNVFLNCIRVRVLLTAVNVSVRLAVRCIEVAALFIGEVSPEKAGICLFKTKIRKSRPFRILSDIDDLLLNGWFFVVSFAPLLVIF